MVAGVKTVETKRSKFIKSVREIAYQSYIPLKRFNFKFLIAWSTTDNFQYWADHHNQELLPFRSEFCEEKPKKLFVFPLENSALFVGYLRGGQKQGEGIHYDT